MEVRLLHANGYKENEWHDGLDVGAWVVKLQITAECNIDAGGVGYIPTSDIKRELETLISSNKNVPSFSSTQMYIERSEDKQKITSVRVEIKTSLNHSQGNRDRFSKAQKGLLAVSNDADFAKRTTDLVINKLTEAAKSRAGIRKEAELIKRFKKEIKNRESLANDKSWETFCNREEKRTFGIEGNSGGGI